MTTPIATPTTTMIDLDGSAFVAALEELGSLLEGLEKSVHGFLVRLFDTGDLAAHLARIEQVDGIASGTGELRIRLKPSDRFLGLMAALRAGDVDLVAVESILHGSGSVGWSGDSNEDRAPGESQGSPGGNQAGERGLSS